MSVIQYVHYGYGSSAPRSWRNFDASPTLRFERVPFIGRFYTRNKNRFAGHVEYGDIVNGLPIPDGYCKGVYCSHVLEHLSMEDCKRALRNTHRIMKLDGIFRLVVPDLATSIDNYLSNYGPDAAILFLRETGLGKERRIRGIRAAAIEWLGNSQHLWMWDYKSLARELQAAGFSDIRRAAYGDSEDGMFADVENKVRWDACLGIECRK